MWKGKDIAGQEAIIDWGSLHSMLCWGASLISKTSWYGDGSAIPNSMSPGLYRTAENTVCCPHSTSKHPIAGGSALFFSQSKHESKQNKPHACTLQNTQNYRKGSMWEQPNLFNSRQGSVYVTRALDDRTFQKHSVTVSGAPGSWRDTFGKSWINADQAGFCIRGQGV